MPVQIQHAAKALGDVAAYGTVWATLAGFLPPLAALFSIIWLSIQITEKLAGIPFHKLVACVYQRLFHPK